MEKENQQQEYLQELRHENSWVSEEEYIFPISPRFIIISFAACNIFFLLFMLLFDDFKIFKWFVGAE